MADRSNVVLVTVDSLRADHCGFMGYEKDTTPTLDGMAEEGLVFENAIAPGPRTPESMPVVFTGQFLPDDLPADMVPQRDAIRRHMRTRRTLPERLSAAGYHTIGFTPNPFTSRYFDFDRGFDRFADFMGEEGGGLYRRLFRGWLGGDTVSNVLRLSRNMVLREEVFKPWEAFYEEVIESAEQAPEPYFLWVFLMDVHEPYLAGRGYRSQSWWERWSAIWKLQLNDKETPFDERTRERLVTAYDDSIRYTDAFFERLLDDLDGDPIVAVHGDHGEAFGEHGVYSHEPYLYEENVHVPFVVYGSEEGTVEKPTSLRALPDLLTTVTGPSGFDGPEIVEARTARDDTVALRTRTLKYIDGTGGRELYDLDRGELSEIDDGDARELCSTLVELRREWRQEHRRVRGAAEAVAGSLAKSEQEGSP